MTGQSRTFEEKLAHRSPSGQARANVLVLAGAGAGAGAATDTCQEPARRNSLLVQRQQPTFHGTHSHNSE
jgi:hypothetical protein